MVKTQYCEIQVHLNKLECPWKKFIYFSNSTKNGETRVLNKNSMHTD